MADLKEFEINGFVYKFKDETARNSISALQTAVGSPLVANQAADMTDTTKIYVYTGSETGYNTGHWYYYNGSAWTDGGVYNSQGIGYGSVTGRNISDDVKQALLACFEKVAWVDADGHDYYDELESVLYGDAVLLSITAVYTQSGTVYDDDSLDDLKSDLVVTAHYDDNTSRTINAYTLSGILAEGTSIITVSYGGKSTTFNVTVTDAWWNLEWTYKDGGLPSVVDSANWGVQANTTQKGVSFVTGEGIRVNHTSDAFMSYYPKNHETSSNSTFEVVFNIATMPTVNGLIIRHGNGSIGMQATVGNNGVSIDNGSTQISGISIATGTDYTVKSVCDTTGTCHLYLNGAEIWSGSASAIGNKKNYVMVTSHSSTDLYIREIRFGV